MFVFKGFSRFDLNALLVVVLGLLDLLLQQLLSLSYLLLVDVLGIGFHRRSTFLYRFLLNRLTFDLLELLLLQLLVLFLVHL